MRRPHPAHIGGAMLVCALLELAGALWLTRSNDSDSPLVSIRVIIYIDDRMSRLLCVCVIGVRVSTHPFMLQAQCV